MSRAHPRDPQNSTGSVPCNRSSSALPYIAAESLKTTALAPCPSSASRTRISSTQWPAQVRSPSTAPPIHPSIHPSIEKADTSRTPLSLVAGFHPHLPSFMHRFLAKGLGAGMWFFIFYRAR